MNKITSFIPCLLLIFSVSFNLIFLYPETTIKSEVNDNVFAFALISRMNLAWDEGFVALFDHWNSQWAQGFPLPHFYQHIPDLAVVIIYRIFQEKISLWEIFEYFKYLMLCLIPLSYFISAKKFGLSNLTASFASLVSTQISTQYLYGTDYNALIWRGSGMYTQLWGIFFLPLAVSSVYAFLSNNRSKFYKDSNFYLSVFFLSLTTSSHVVFGFIALVSSFLIPLILALQGHALRSYFSRLLAVFLSSFLLLAYWLIPLLQHSVFRNKSIWDDVNKFDSYGFIQITKWFLNGELFDANRLPILTILVILGLFVSLYIWSKNYKLSIINYKLNLLFPALFILWFLLYLGRKTWGPLIDIIPLMNDLHIHRLINGLHFAGIFIIGITIAYFVEQVSIHFSRPFIKIIIVIIIILPFIPVFRERSEYLLYNTKLINDYNKSWAYDNQDFQKVLNFLGPPPLTSRIYPGRPGNWGNTFFVGSTKVYLELSQRGYDVFAFLPETWSLNSDIEQYFDENREDHFRVFNVGYYLAPPDQKPPSFAKKVFQSGKYHLYKIETSPFEFIESPITLAVNKNTFLNPNIAWLKSDWPKHNLYPLVLYSGYNDYKNYSALNFIDSTTYILNGQYFPLFSPSPFTNPNQNFQPPDSTLQFRNTKVTPSSYHTEIHSPKAANILLKATYHPYWIAKIDGNPAQISMASPSFMSISVPSGSHKIEFVYTPPLLKITLIFISFISFIFITVLTIIKIIPVIV